MIYKNSIRKKSKLSFLHHIEYIHALYGQINKDYKFTYDMGKVYFCCNIYIYIYNTFMLKF